MGTFHKYLPSAFPEFDDHQFTVFASDKKSGLQAFIAIHNTTLGPATGGTRYWFYSAPEEGLRDALRLSKAMTYKCALADVPFGGGKAVILADPSHPKTPALLKAYAQKINFLGGNFTTGEDVGFFADDVQILKKYSPYINGVGKKGEDCLSPWAVQGIYLSLKTGLKSVYGDNNIGGRTFAVKGLGKLGRGLCELLAKEGGQVVAADTNPQAVRTIKKACPNVKIVSPDEIHRQKVDAFCPCALGGEFNVSRIKELKCKLICGGANNQLANGTSGKLLWQKNILYIPDYVANAGGLIRAVADVQHFQHDKKWVAEKVQNISVTVGDIIKLSLKRNKPTNETADELAEQKICSARKKLALKHTHEPQLVGSLR